MIPAQTKSIHWSLLDPAQATGTFEERLEGFRNIRDEIKKLITELI